MKNTLWTGAWYLLRGFNLLIKPGLKRFVAIPFLINILLFEGLYLLSRHFVIQLNQWLVAHLPAWLEWLSSVAWLTYVVCFLLVMLYVFITLSNIVCLPFNSLLSEKVETYLTGKPAPSLSLWSEIKNVPRLLQRQLALMSYYLPRAILLVSLFFIPVVQFVAGLLWIVFNAWMMTIQHIDYPMDNHHRSFLELRKALSTKRWTALGFGGGILLCSMIPVLNFFVIPAAVAGATQLWVNEFSTYRM